MIAIKGHRHGLLIAFSGPADEPWLTRLRELEDKLNANPGFFKGGQVAFDVRDMALSDDDLRRSVTLLESHDVTLWAVVSKDELTQARVRALRLSDRLAPLETSPAHKPIVAGNGAPATPFVGVDSTPEAPTAKPTPTPTPAAAPQEEDHTTEGTDGLLARRRVRSGQVLRHPGHIVVIGDVNPGAQLIAGGDIIVWGRLHGMAHAGALGDTGAVICALDMSPALIKIADAARALRPGEQRSRNKAGKPEMARLKDQQIMLTTWERSA
jgi:septum site-determining protein MinC